MFDTLVYQQRSKASMESRNFTFLRFPRELLRVELDSFELKKESSSSLESVHRRIKEEINNERR